MKKQKLERGEYGYLRQRKQNALTGTFLMVLIGVAIFVTGLLLNNIRCGEFIGGFSARPVISAIFLFMMSPISFDADTYVSSI